MKLFILETSNASSVENDQWILQLFGSTGVQTYIFINTRTSLISLGSGLNPRIFFWEAYQHMLSLENQAYEVN